MKKKIITENKCINRGNRNAFFLVAEIAVSSKLHSDKYSFAAPFICLAKNEFLEFWKPDHNKAAKKTINIYLKNPKKLLEFEKEINKKNNFCKIITL